MEQAFSCFFPIVITFTNKGREAVLCSIPTQGMWCDRHALLIRAEQVRRGLVAPDLGEKEDPDFKE
ncbi:MAG: hypothetical protein A3C84_03530 [Candidatus Ryanbacteria bacterium RIFCSPHIGHO2_02_FULL_48_12]|uniref:Uncharacterized protein n=1 Tax=Candidatus Ryanbacteria bacterium RIFCSPHIGHO2_01_FULL_48_27 TaxID=1802115 RepID=A0A1G2G768_9BACT|nr:MAG: hypothetical protein A2756_02900 [Candidatus Ryanbacteria bacterium RIFCSPHIGHO2_01_FULL_48_27]OGZ49415.1 MAG: hypothetical protein A3C84_03530 [Candidatus Ryanbacteria bacterium RIFCSPHIGHO2_02_FULL_48_12]